MKDKIRDLQMQLKVHGNGANAHTANQASMYLSNYFTSLERLADLSEKALISGDFTELKKHMKGWW